MNVRLIELTLPMCEALADGDLVGATELIGLDIPPAFLERTEVWQYLVGLLTEHPGAAGWTRYAVVDGDTIVGNAGFKGAPDPDGMVEIGYGIQPDHRRRGYAVAAVHLLLDRAAADPRVRIVRAEVVEGNAASVGVLTSAGFLPDGERIDPKDGRLLLFTHPPVGDAHPGRRRP